MIPRAIKRASPRRSPSSRYQRLVDISRLTDLLDDSDAFPVAGQFIAGLLLRCVVSFGHYGVMAYTGRGSTGNRDGHGWAIAGAFVGQAAIIAGLGVVLATASTSGGVTRMITGPTPAQAAPESAASLAPEVQPLIELPVPGRDGRAAAAASRLPAGIVRARVHRPAGPGPYRVPRRDGPRRQNITSMSVNLDRDSQDARFSRSSDPVQRLRPGEAPGTHVFR